MMENLEFPEKITLRGVGVTRQVFIKIGDEKEKRLSITPSLKVYSHTSEFNWGYGGSGPSQLALALLLFITKSHSSEAKKWASRWHQLFKWSVIARFPQRSFEIELRFKDWASVALIDGKTGQDIDGMKWCKIIFNGDKIEEAEVVKL